MKKKLILFIFLLILTVNVNATCNSTELKRLKTLANKVEYNYIPTLKKERNELTGEETEKNIATYKLEFLNLDPDLKVRYKIDNMNFLYDLEGTAIEDLLVGDKITAYIYSYTVDPDCTEQQLRKISVTLPHYNSFSERKECKEYPKFSYCKQYLDKIVTITEDEFEELLDGYKKGNELIISNKGDYEKSNDYNTPAIIAFSVIIVAYLLAVVLYVVKIKKKSKLQKLLDDLHV